MKKIILAATLLLCSLMIAQGVSIFEPSMTITSIGIVNSPIGEEVDKVIDGDNNTKFLDFEIADGQGFIVDLGTIPATATYFELTTANDFPVRDPIDFEVSGSLDGTNFTSIDMGSIICLPDRFRTRIYDITNTNAYSYYMINFTAPCDPSGGTGIPSIQIAEVQLYEAELGVSDSQLLADDFMVYPNPNHGVFTLKYSGNANLNEARISTISGQLVEKIDLANFRDSQEIAIPNFAAGVYFIQISSRNKTVVKKIQVN
jgi:hypothetical protein